MPHRNRIPAAVLLALTGAMAIAQPDRPPAPDPQPQIAPVPPEHAHRGAQRQGVPQELGQISDALRELISADYLSDDERAALRVEHGLWTDEDLLNPDSAAKAALAVGAYNHPFLRDPAARPLQRAQGALMRGEPARALDILDQPQSQTQIQPQSQPQSQPNARPTPSSLSVRAQALEMLGRTDEAIATLTSLEDLLATTRLDDADEIAWGVEGLMQLTRLRGPQGDAKAQYQNLAKLLANARDNIDRTSWRVRLVEAQLLYAHNNYKDAHSAAVEALRLHPRNAQAAALIGNMAVDSFDFDTADQIAAKLDAMAAVFNADDPQNPPPTLDSAIIRARVALRRKDPAGAEAALDPMLAAMPDQRDLLELNAAAAAAGFRMRSAQRLLDQYDRLSPGSPFALMRVAEILGEYRQYDEAQEMYARVIDRAPHWGQPRLNLGLMLVQAGHDELARRTLTDALALDPFDIRAQNSLKLVTELATYGSIESEHFIVRFKADNAADPKSGADAFVAAEMPPILERINARVTGDAPGGVDFQPARKTVIELMPNHEWFAVRIGGMPSIHTMAASTGPIIAIEAPREGPGSSAGPYDWPRVLQHEYTHTVNLARTHNRVIHWMTEANAVFNEDQPRSSQTWALLTSAYKDNQLFDLVDINTAFVRPKKPTDRALAYAQGAWMFEYIVEHYGKEAPLAVFDASAAGRDSTDAFEEALGVTPESFLTGFRAWAKQQLLDHALILPDGVPDIYELFGAGEDNPAANNHPDTLPPPPTPPSPPTLPTLEALNQLLIKYPNHPQLISMRLGLVLVGADERLTDDQVTLLTQAAQALPTDDAPRRRLARHYLAASDPNERILAIPSLEYLDARELHSPAFAAELALLYVQTKEPDKAMAKALRAVAIAPFDADQRERAARVALLTGNMEMAAHQLEALIVLEPDREIHKRRVKALKAKMGE